MCIRKEDRLFLISQAAQPRSSIPITECGVRLSYLVKLACALVDDGVDSYGIVQKLILPTTRATWKEKRGRWCMLDACRNALRGWFKTC